MARVPRRRILVAELGDRHALAIFTRLYAHNRSHDVLLSRTPDVTAALLASERFAAIAVRCHPSRPDDLARIRAQISGSSRLIALLEHDAGSALDALYAAGAD